MSLWNSFSYSFKEFHYLFLSVVIIFIFNILLEYNNFLKFKNQKHYFINNALLT
ncbi:ComEC/Rec2 family competence protein, partial [Campylobacter jejuni]|nr:ComEC/Rec2 family competence protein [Campylobacter jejuni]